MSNTRAFALVFGIIFLLMGIAGFIPGLLSPPDQPIAVNAMHGRLLGLFPVNAVHDLAHLVFGVWGIVAYRTLSGSLLYARVVAIAYGVLVIMGLIPGLNVVFGLMPIHGNDVWLHLILAAVAAYFGFFAHERLTAEEPTRRRATVR
ncbi:MAG: DUF4383 domain-containing protein [Gemmatimonas sp.]